MHSITVPLKHFPEPCLESEGEVTNGSHNGVEMPSGVEDLGLAFDGEEYWNVNLKKHETSATRSCQKESEAPGRNIL